MIRDKTRVQAAPEQATLGRALRLWRTPELRGRGPYPAQGRPTIAVQPSQLTLRALGGLQSRSQHRALSWLAGGGPGTDQLGLPAPRALSQVSP